MLEDILLCDPISKRGNAALERLKNEPYYRKLSIKQFYNKIYVHPFFRRYKNSVGDLGFFETGEDDLLYSLSGTDIDNLNRKYEQFKELFESENSDELLCIKASAGSGKTILLNYLKRERRKKYFPDYVDIAFLNDTINKACEMNFDLERSSETIKAGGIEFPYYTYKKGEKSEIVFNTQWHFYIMIIKSLFDNSMKIIKNNPLKKGIYSNFKMVYGVDYSNEVFELYEYIKKTTYNQKDERIIREKILRKIVAASFDKNKSTTENTKTALENLFRFVFIVTKKDTFCQTMISFDNIEHLIKSKKRVFDEDIQNIIGILSTFVENENTYFHERGLNFARFFKVIIVVRDTTEKMIYCDVHNNTWLVDKAINVSGWFQLEKIYENKYLFFNVDKNRSSVKFIDLISKDIINGYRNNLIDQISTMYNHNNRRITRILTRISTIFDKFDLQNDFSDKCIDYNMFEKIWNYNGDNTDSKYLCRNAVLWLVFNIINNTKYFDKLYDDIYGKTYLKTTFAKRLLTWLANKESYKTDTYYTFNEVIDNVLKSPDISFGHYVFNDEELRTFCDVLIVLDEYRFENENEQFKGIEESSANYWCQLVILKYNDFFVKSNFKSSVLCEEIKQQYNDKTNTNTDSIISGVKLTEAGYFYVNKMFDFEYLSCRYNKIRYPLLFMKDKNEIESTLESVFQAASKIIESSLTFEANFFKKDYHLSYRKLYHLNVLSKKNSIIAKSIPYRIIIQHTDYLKAFKQYISNDDLQVKINIFNQDDRAYLYDLANQYLEKYKLIYSQLRSSNYCLSDGTQIKNYLLYQE